MRRADGAEVLRLRLEQFLGVLQSLREVALPPLRLREDAIVVDSRFVRGVAAVAVVVVGIVLAVVVGVAAGGGASVAEDAAAALIVVTVEERSANLTAGGDQLTCGRVDVRLDRRPSEALSAPLARAHL